MIRLARPSDIPALHRVEASAATAFIGTHMAFAADHPPNDPADLLAAIDRQLLWVVEADGEVIGFVYAEAFHGGLYVRELSVAAAAQKQGHGAALMATVIAAAAARGDRQLMLTTDRSLAWNAPFYTRLGFRIVEGDAIPVEAQRRLEAQYAAGFDPAQRCAMVRPVT